MYLQADKSTDFIWSTTLTFHQSIGKKGFSIRTIQKSVGGQASTIMPTFNLHKKATINSQDVKTNSPNRIFLSEWKSLMELNN